LAFAEPYQHALGKGDTAWLKSVNNSSGWQAALIRPGRELTKMFLQIFASLFLVSFLEYNLHEYIGLIPYKSYIYK